MNTLLLDREFGRALEVAAELYRLGADALIVQDIGLIAALRRCFPDLPIHASTQMTVHNAEGVRACARMGLSRAVLAGRYPWRRSARYGLSPPCHWRPLCMGPCA